MKHYDSIDNVKYNKSLYGEEVWAFNKLDGQNFCARYNMRTKQFTAFGSRNCMVDENSEMFADTVKYFKSSRIPVILNYIIKQNSGKKGYFCGIEEITFFFEWYGNNSFAGFHQEGDEMHLALIDVFRKKKGYIEPKVFFDMFCNVPNLETPELIYKGKLNQEFVDSIKNNDWTKPDCQYPHVKEGVVIRRSTILKGQNMPKAKAKTDWWVNKLHEKYTEEECKLLE